MLPVVIHYTKPVIGKCFCFLAVLLAFVVNLAIAVSAHPADGLIPFEPQDGYGTDAVGIDPSWSLGDLYFVCPYPDPSSLSTREKYMLNGARDPQFGLLQAWYSDVVFVVEAYEKRTGQIPQRFSIDMLKAVAVDPNDIPSGRAEFFKSPMTNEFPLLQCAEVSPGQLYIRKLTESEMRHFADLNPYWNRLWVQHEDINPETGQLESIMMLSDVYYIRVYGENGVIHSDLHYVWTSI